MSGGPLRNSLANIQVNPRNLGRGLFVAAAISGCCALGYHSVYTVEGGHCAILFSRINGVLPEVAEEGLHFKIPWVHIPQIFSVRTRATTIPSLTGSKDLQMVNITLRVLSKPKISELADIYDTLGHDYDQRVLPSISNEVLKGVVARFNASQLITQRELVSEMIQTRLTERAADFHILLDDVSITHLSFGKEYTAAIEAKQVAQQDAERARFIVEKAEQDKRSTIIKGEGDAEAAKLVSLAMDENPYYIELKRIEYAKDIARELAGARQNKLYLNGDNLLFNLLKAMELQTDDLVPKVMRETERLVATK